MVRCRHNRTHRTRWSTGQFLGHRYLTNLFDAAFGVDNAGSGPSVSFLLSQHAHIQEGSGNPNAGAPVCARLVVNAFVQAREYPPMREGSLTVRRTDQNERFRKW
jgi:hypothetical protein